MRQLIIHTSYAVLDVLQQLAVRRNDVCLQTHDKCGHTGQHQRAGQNQRLHMTAAIPAEGKYQKADAQNHADSEEHRANASKASQRTIHQECPQNRQHGALHISHHAAEQTGRAQLRVRPDRNRDHAHLIAASLYDCLQRIGIFVHNIHAHSSVTAVGTETARRIRNIRLRSLAHHPTAEVLQFLLDR